MSAANELVSPPNIPDDRPSHGKHNSGHLDKDEARPESTKEHSRSRGSKSSRQSSPSSHRPSSGTSEGMKSSTSSPHQSSLSPHRFSKASGKTPEKEQSKRTKLRISEVNGNDIPSPRLLQSPTGSTKESSSKHRRLSHNKTPDTKHSKRNLRIAEVDGSMLQSPTGSSHRHRSSHRRSYTSRTPDSKQSKSRLRMSEPEFDIPPPLLGQHAMPTIEATTAPDIDEIENALKQGREEGRNEQKIQDQQRGQDHQQQEERNFVFVATPAPKDNMARKYAIASFVIVVIAAGVVAWQVLSGNTSNNAKFMPTPFSPPTEDDCLAISQGLAVQEQYETSVRTFAVEMNFSFVGASNVNIALLKAELEIRVQRYVLPLLIGCAIDGPVVVENNSFVVAHALLDLTRVGGLEDCNADSGGQCSLVYLQMDLFLKDIDWLSESILELIAQVFEHEGLLQLLNLLSPVEAIDTKLVFEVLSLSSSLPSSSPSLQEDETAPDNDSPSSETCLAIGSGSSVEGQEDLVLQEYIIFLDVILDTVTEDLTLVTMELETKLQSLLMPPLAGCIDEGRRRLQGNNLIVNALVDAEVEIGEECLPESEGPCYRYAIHLDIYIPSIVSSADFTEVIMAKFLESPLVERLGLLLPFVKITVVKALAQTPSAMPSFSPSANPSIAPTMMPSQSPSALPSSSPTPQPTPRPTPPPTAEPTAFPTKQPTLRPTREPTPPPTGAPTPSPSTRPTSSPTKPCIQTNAELTSAVNDWTSVSPGFRAAVQAQYGPVGDWCFGAGVTSMASLFEYKSTFNDDIANWDVSSVTDMSSMFRIATSFNQDIGNWDVSSVTTMSSMFSYAASFNQNIGNWDVSSVVDGSSMFSGAAAFNQDIRNWDVSSMTSTSSMFSSASAFNQDISSWRLSSVGNIGSMFGGATDFNQNLCAWGSHIPNSVPTSFIYMFYFTNCPQTSDPNLFASPPGPFCYIC